MPDRSALGHRWVFVPVIHFLRLFIHIYYHPIKCILQPYSGGGCWLSFFWNLLTIHLLVEHWTNFNNEPEALELFSSIELCGIACIQQTRNFSIHNCHIPSLDVFRAIALYMPGERIVYLALDRGVTLPSLLLTRTEIYNRADIFILSHSKLHFVYSSFLFWLPFFTVVGHWMGGDCSGRYFALSLSTQWSRLFKFVMIRKSIEVVNSICQFCGSFSYCFW